jgi:hypothetical protein
VSADLGPILRDREYVVPRCAGFTVDRRKCEAIDSRNALSKPAALRVARRHAAESGHSVVLYIAHYQIVRPRNVA